jgi:hypothetical protein
MFIWSFLRPAKFALLQVVHTRQVVLIPLEPEWFV